LKTKLHNHKPQVEFYILNCNCNLIGFEKEERKEKRRERKGKRRGRRGKIGEEPNRNSERKPQITKTKQKTKNQGSS
jgi:hypothetical protein